MMHVLLRTSSTQAMDEFAIVHLHRSDVICDRTWQRALNGHAMISEHPAILVVVHACVGGALHTNSKSVPGFD